MAQDWTERLQVTGLLVDPARASEIELNRLAVDSQEVRPGDWFVALRGHKVDGHTFIDKAVQNGAVAIVCETAPAHVAGAVIVRVTDSRRALAELASLTSGDPADRMDLFATTGTNGKTTTAALIADALERTGTRCGFIGTTGYRIDTEFMDASHTTPSPIRVYELLAAMEEAGCSACSMEASSHALDQWRIRPSDVAVGIFTNLSRDHLDYHGTLERYLAAKERLFIGLEASAAAVLNRDDASWDQLASSTSARVLSYGHGHDADIRYRIHAQALSGLDLEIDGRRAAFRLAAAYNAANLTAAYTALIAHGMATETAFTALREAPPVAGRFERVLFTDGTTVIVDYAHTPDALENVLRAARAGLAPGTRLWVVFGCGGDRDKGKRPEMGAIAERLADRVLATSDNPRFEDPEVILADVRTGFHRPDEAIWIADRAEAVRRVATLAESGDAVVIAGKGHETYQAVRGRKVPFDDRLAAREAFRASGRIEAANA